MKSWRKVPDKLISLLLMFVATHAAHLRSPSFLLTHFTSHGWREPSHTFMNPLDEELVFCRDGAAVVLALDAS